MFHVKHSNGQTSQAPSRKALVVMIVFAVIAVALGIVLSCSQPTAKEAQPSSITASQTNQGNTAKTGSKASQDDADAGNTEGSTSTSDSVSTASTDENSSEGNGDSNEQSSSKPAYEEDVVLVTPADGASVEDIAAAIGVDPSQVSDSGAGFFEVTLPEGMTVDEAVETLETSSVIESAQPNYIYYLETDEDGSLEVQSEEEEPPYEDEFPTTTSGADDPDTSESSTSQEDEEPLEEGDLEDQVTNADEEASDDFEIQDESESSTSVEESTEDISGTDAVALEDEALEEEATEYEAVEDDDEALTLEGNEDETTSSGEPSSSSESSSSSTTAKKYRLKTNDPNLNKQWALESIHAFDAWGMLAECNPQQVTVAVLDEGFDLDHEDLAANILRDNDGAPVTYNAVDNSSDVSEIDFIDSHGSHVAGIIAAQANNEIGVAGVSYNQKILPIKCFKVNENAETGDKTATSNTTLMAKAFAYILLNNDTYDIRVINMSFGITGKSKKPDSVLEGYFAQAKSKGIVTVAAAGNSGTGYDLPTDNYPSDSANVVGVINLKKKSDDPLTVERSAISNYNIIAEDGTFEHAKEISAPGTGIYSTYDDDSYGNKTGTSMAAPCVAGVFALLFAAKPELTADQAIDIVYNTAIDLGPEGFDAETGYGEVNAGAAMAQALGITWVPSTDADDEEDPIQDPSSQSTSSQGSESQSSSSQGSESQSSSSHGTSSSSASESKSTSSSSKKQETPAIKTPKYTVGASEMPIGSTSNWKLKNCSIRVISGDNVVSVAKNGYTVKAKRSGKATIAVIDNAGKTVKTSKVTVYKLKGAKTIANAAKSKLSMCVYKDSKKSGAKVVLRNAGKMKSEKIRLVYKKGYYYFVFEHSSKLLKIKKSSKKQNAPAIQATLSHAKSLQWKVQVDKKNRLTFVNRKTGKVLAIKGKSVVQRKPTGKSNEKWIVQE